MTMGCQGKRIKPDNVNFNHKYHAAEILADNKSHIGLAAFKVELNRPFLFSVQGIHNGRIRVDSNSCGIHETQSYSNFEEVPFMVTPKKVCVIAISIYPEFTTDESRGVMWRHFTALLVLWPTEENFLAKTKQFYLTEKVNYEFEEFSGSYFSYDGCGITQHTGYLEVGIKTYNFPSLTRRDFCMYYGFIHNPNRSMDSVMLASFFDDTFQKLAYPEIQFRKGEIIVFSDQNVSMLNFNGKTIWSNKGIFSNPYSPRKLRVITTGGRQVVCDIYLEKYSCQR